MVLAGSTGWCGELALSSRWGWMGHVRAVAPSPRDPLAGKEMPGSEHPCSSPGCTDDVMTSDHSPVFGSFEVGVTSQFVSKKGRAQGVHGAGICPPSACLGTTRDIPVMQMLFPVP